MRVLLINNHHYLMGGAHRVYFNTAELLNKGWHSVCFYSTKDKNTLKDPNDKLFPLVPDFKNLGFLKRVINLFLFFYNKTAKNNLQIIINQFKPEIAHVHLFIGGLTPSIIHVLNKNNIPIVHTVHDYRLICPAYLFLDGENKICERCFKDKFYNCTLNRCSSNNLLQSIILTIEAYVRKFFFKPEEHIDAFLFVSKFIRDKHIEFNSIYKEKNYFLYNFIPEISNIKPNTNKGEYFLYYGRLSREKGILSLIEAAKLANIKLAIVGSGPLMDLVNSQVDENISFLGYKSGEELFDIVKNSSFVIVPSEWYENNPLTIIESYSYGKPIIGSSIGGITELVLENQTGYLFESRNIRSICNCLKKASLIGIEDYKEMSRKAREFAEKNFNPLIHLDSLINIYRNTINNYEK